MSKPLHEFPSDASWLLDLAWRLRNVPVTHGVDGFDIDCLGDIAHRLALTAPQLHQHGGGVETALRAALEPFAQYPTADGLPSGLLRIDDEHPILFFGQEIIATVGDFRRARAALAQQPLSVPEGWRWIVPAMQDRLKTVTVRQAAKQIGISSASVSRISRGNEPTIDHYFQIKAWLSAAPTHPIQSDLSCSRAREGGTGE